MKITFLQRCSAAIRHIWETTYWIVPEHRLSEFDLPADWQRPKDMKPIEELMEHHRQSFPCAECSTDVVVKDVKLEELLGGALLISRVSHCPTCKQDELFRLKFVNGIALREYPEGWVAVIGRKSLLAQLWDFLRDPLGNRS